MPPLSHNSSTRSLISTTKAPWLDNAHRKLDAAVFAAYGWPADPSTGSAHDLPDEEILVRLLALNLVRAGATT